MIQGDVATVGPDGPPGEEEPAPRSNRGFWIIAVATGMVGVLMVVAIFANRPLKDSIAHTESDLNASLARAGRIHASTGSFAGADAAALGAGDDERTYVDADTPSSGPGSVSVFAAEGVWAAAVAARPQACFYIKQVDNEDTLYGVGTVCTGRAALDAADDRW